MRAKHILGSDLNFNMLKNQMPKWFLKKFKSGRWNFSEYPLNTDYVAQGNMLVEFYKETKHQEWKMLSLAGGHYQNFSPFGQNLFRPAGRCPLMKANFSMIESKPRWSYYNISPKIFILLKCQLYILKNRGKTAS